MGALSTPALKGRGPIWLTATALGGLAWNLFGTVQFAGSVTATEASLMASGLNAEQAGVMLGLPVWASVAFGIGVIGGVVGSVLLLLRHSSASIVLGLSLLAYCALWIADAVHGVFAALGAPQIAVLTTVVAIAAALFAISHHRQARV